MKQELSLAFMLSQVRTPTAHSCPSLGVYRCLGEVVGGVHVRLDRSRANFHGHLLVASEPSSSMQP